MLVPLFFLCLQAIGQVMESEVLGKMMLLVGRGDDGAGLLLC